MLEIRKSQFENLCNKIKSKNQTADNETQPVKMISTVVPNPFKIVLFQDTKTQCGVYEEQHT